MTNMEKLLWAMGQSDRAAKASSDKLHDAIKYHDDKFPITTSNIAEAAASELEQAAKDLRYMIAVEREARLSAKT